MFTTDPAPLVHKDTSFLYIGHETASTKTVYNQMPDWHAFSLMDLMLWNDCAVRPGSFNRIGTDMKHSPDDLTGKFLGYHDECADLFRKTILANAPLNTLNIYSTLLLLDNY